jgi:hypothetical protein
MRCVAEREDALLGARFLLLAPSTGDGGVKGMLSKAWRKACVFITSVKSALPWVVG